MALCGVVVCRAAMAIRAVIYGRTAMAIGGDIIGLTDKGICGNNVYHATSAMGIAVFRRLAVFCHATSAICSVIVCHAATVLWGVISAMLLWGYTALSLATLP
jgi:hypothetical protein